MDELIQESKQPDKIETSLRKMVKLADENRNYLVGALIAIVLIGAAVYFRVAQSQRYAREASDGLVKADSTSLLRERWKKYSGSSQGPFYAIELSARLYDEQAEKSQKSGKNVVEDRLTLLDEGMKILSSAVQDHKKHSLAPRLREMLAVFQAQRAWVEKYGPEIAAAREPREKKISPKPEKLAQAAILDKPEDNPVITLKLERGEIVIELFEDKAPNHVANLISLAFEGFYDGLKWHRVEDWVVQTGCPEGTGSGDPGYSIKAEFTGTHERGAFGMARGNDDDSAGSQFYIVKQPMTSIDGKYTIFGKVLSGLEFVDAIGKDEKLVEVRVDKVRKGQDGGPKKYVPTVVYKAGKGK